MSTMRECVVAERDSRVDKLNLCNWIYRRKQKACICFSLLGISPDLNISYLHFRDTWSHFEWSEWIGIHSDHSKCDQVSLKWSYEVLKSGLFPRRKKQIHAFCLSRKECILIWINSFLLTNFLKTLHIHFYITPFKM